MMRYHAIVIGTVIGLVTAGPLVAQNPVDAPTFDWTAAVPAGATLRIADVDGDISVTPSTTDHVQVHGERTHVRSGGQALVFEVVQSGNDVTICARHPGGHCDPDGEHGGGFQMMHVGQSPAANFTVQLPAGVKLMAKTSDGRVDIKDAGADVVAKSGDGAINVAGAAGTVDAHSGDGDITLDGVKGAVTAHTGDGHIRVTAGSGPLRLTSGDGDVEVHLAALGDGQTVKVHTGDGNVMMYLPSTFVGNVDASTGDGTVESDFPIAMTGRMNTHHLRGTVGAAAEAAASINVSTGDGDVRLKKG
jgi:hypothetical protein